MEPVEISAGRLHLRPWSPYDEDAVLAACQDAEIQRWTTVPSPYTREHAHAWVTTVAPAGWADGTRASWAVLDATTGALLGYVGLHAIQDGAAEVGYWCAAEGRGTGVMTEAVGAVCRWGFAVLDLELIEWTAAVGNWGSRAVAEKCGFRVDGLRRRRLLHHGSRRDAWVGSLLRGEPVADRRALPAPPVLTDGVVTLRGWRPEDAADTARACGDPLTARWLPVPVPYTLADARSYLEQFVSGAWADGTSAELAVTDAATGELIGALGLKLHGRDRGYGEVGYWTAPWARGRGVAGRGAGLLAQWGLDVLGLARVELLADVDNLGSQRAAEKAGFVREGVARQSRRNRDGTARDMVLFSWTRPVGSAAGGPR
ncbi:MAG: family N-acetyltransferase [Frankiales bacterium]|nr:family N-acetyltransferase [Frankiales bacterium]